MEAPGDPTFTGQGGREGGIVNFHFAHINNMKLVQLEYRDGILSRSSCRPALLLAGAQFSNSWMDCFNHLLQSLFLSRFLAGPHLKKSAQKCDKHYPFVPTNLHLQRFWIENLSLRKFGYHDIFSSAAFTAGADSSESGGLIKYYLRGGRGHIRAGLPN